MLKSKRAEISDQLSKVNNDIATGIMFMSDYKKDLSSLQQAVDANLTDNQCFYVDSVIENLLNSADNLRHATNLYNYLCQMITRYENEAVV